MSENINYLRVVKAEANPSGKAEKGVKKPWLTTIGFAKPFKNGLDPESVGYSLSLHLVPGTDAKGHYRFMIVKAKKTEALSWDLEREVTLLDKEDNPTDTVKKIGDLRLNLCGQRNIKKKDESIEQKNDAIGSAFFRWEDGKPTVEMDIEAIAMPLPKFDPISGESRINLRVFMPKSDLKGGNGDVGAADSEQDSDDDNAPF